MSDKEIRLSDAVEWPPKVFSIRCQHCREYTRPKKCKNYVEETICGNCLGYARRGYAEPMRARLWHQIWHYYWSFKHFMRERFGIIIPILEHDSKKERKKMDLALERFIKSLPKPNRS